MPPPVLVPLDGSELAKQALPYAESLAGSACELILLEVGEDEDSEFRLQEEHGDSCAQLKATVGDPAEEILQVAEELGAGMIAMTTHGQGADERSALGRVADEVTRRSTLPVLVVRPRADDDGSSRGIQRLVVPLDGSLQAEAGLSVARLLAKRLQVPIHLMTMVDERGLGPQEVAAVRQRLEADGLQVDTEVQHGPGNQSLVDSGRPGDVIVLTTHGSNLAGSDPLGPVARNLIREGSVPVLLVPDVVQRDRKRDLQESGASGVTSPAPDAGHA